MSTVTQPRVGVPIGSVVVNGHRLEVVPHPEYVRYFESLQLRVGGVMGPSTEDLSAAQFEDAGIEEIRSALYRATDAADQAPGDAYLRAELDDLRARVAALEQGVSL